MQLSEINMCALRVLKYHQIVNDLDAKVAVDEMQLLGWLTLHGLSWPEMLKVFCTEVLVPRYDLVNLETQRICLIAYCRRWQTI